MTDLAGEDEVREGRRLIAFYDEKKLKAGDSVGVIDAVFGSEAVADLDRVVDATSDRPLPLMKRFRGRMRQEIDD